MDTFCGLALALMLTSEARIFDSSTEMLLIVEVRKQTMKQTLILCVYASCVSRCDVTCESERVGTQASNLDKEQLTE